MAFQVRYAIADQIPYRSEPRGVQEQARAHHSAQPDAAAAAGAEETELVDTCAMSDDDPKMHRVPGLHGRQ